MLCIEGCVFTRARFPNPFDQGLGTRKPVWVPFAQAVPPIPVIDPETCLEIARGKCKQGCEGRNTRCQGLVLGSDVQNSIFAVHRSTKWQAPSPRKLNSVRLTLPKRDSRC